MSIQAAIFLDLAVVSVCIALISMRGGLRHSHPAILYLGFHLLVVTARAVSIRLGAPPFLSEMRGYDPPSMQDIARAVNYADVVLVAATIGWISYRRSTHRTGAAADLPPLRRLNGRTAVSVAPETKLSDRHIWAAALVALPIGIYALLTTSASVGDSAVSDLYSSQRYLSVAVTWPGLVLLALIYRYGFRLSLMAPMAVYFAMTMALGDNRFSWLLCIVLICQIYLDRRGRKWPGLGVVAVLVAAILVFLPMKQIARELHSGGGVEAVLSGLRESVPDSLTGRSSGQETLDQMAVTLSLTDRHGELFLGRPYLNALYLPIPRAWWPEKPGLNEHIKEISTDAQPMGQMGGVITIIGDLYLNFRLPGLVLVAFWLARQSMKIYVKAYDRSFLSARRFSYLLLASISIQILRDGLISVPVFLFLPYLPLTAIVLVAWIGAKMRATRAGGTNRVVPGRRCETTARPSQIRESAIKTIRGIECDQGTLQ